MKNINQMKRFIIQGQMRELMEEFMMQWNKDLKKSH